MSETAGFTASMAEPLRYRRAEFAFPNNIPDNSCFTSLRLQIERLEEKVAQMWARNTELHEREAALRAKLKQVTAERDNLKDTISERMASAASVPVSLSDRFGGSLRKHLLSDDGPVVYFLCRAGMVVYIGKTDRLPRRVAEHIRMGKDFDEIFFLRSSPEDLDAMERREIEFFKPHLNSERLHYAPHAPRWTSNKVSRMETGKVESAIL